MSFSALGGSAIIVEGVPIRTGDASRVSQANSVLTVAGADGVLVVYLVSDTIRIVADAIEHFRCIAISSDDSDKCCKELNPLASCPNANK